MAVRPPFHHGAEAPLLISTPSIASVASLAPFASTWSIPSASQADTYGSTTSISTHGPLDPLVTAPLPCAARSTCSEKNFSSDPDSSTETLSSGYSKASSSAAPDSPHSISTPSIFQQMRASTRTTIVFLASLIAFVSVNSLVRALNPSAFIWFEEDKEENQWIATSNSWFDRKACRWLGLCGVAHYKGRFGHRPSHDGVDPEPGDDIDVDWRQAWTSETEQPALWSEGERQLRRIPDYVLQYAPLVHLFSDEQFWPCDIAEHLSHITPYLNYTPIKASWDHPTLRDLNKLNYWDKGRYVFLTSNDDVESRPPWLGGEKNIPVPVEVAEGYPQAESDNGNDNAWNVQSGEDSDGINPMQLQNGGIVHSSGVQRAKRSPEWSSSQAEPLEQNSVGDFNYRRVGGRSDAPAVLIVVDKGDGIVDAFWFYFYSFNLGNVVFKVRFGNHVGDWEHSLVRFHNGEPKAVYFSEHSSGEAYSYEAVEKIGKRPVIYSAEGTHAMYASPGTHAYILPWGLLHDRTNRGPLWDPALNFHAYTYDFRNDTLRASTITPHAPMEWFYYSGHWGDKFYPLSDKRQYRFAGQYHYVNGPLGPRFKNLGRRNVCQGSDEKPCVIREEVDLKPKAKRWWYVGEGEEMSLNDYAQLLNE